jgi:2-octaprenyl-6-methoxyphenol hydroxylase
MKQDADVIVVGGGLAGLAAAAALARNGLSVVHLAPTAPPDRRTSALMMPSVAFMRGAGLIGSPEDIGHKLTTIRIIDATNRLIRAPETVFEATEAGHDAFGWNFANAKLLESFAAAASTAGLVTVAKPVRAYRRSDALGIVTLDDGTELAAPLVVGADGKKSLIRSAAGIATRERPFSEAALVCDLELARPLGGASVEFHYAHGPFTLVPAGERRANLVWIDEEAVLRGAQAGGADALLAALTDKSQRLFGPITITSPSVVFPLSVLSVDLAGRDGVALVGEAAHAFPPIGAQGLNLGLRDVEDLVAAVAATDRSLPDWGRLASQTYGHLRAGDLSRTGGMVDTLFRSLLAEWLPGQVLRSGGLWALKLLPPLRKQAFALGMGERS